MQTFCAESEWQSTQRESKSLCYRHFSLWGTLVQLWRKKKLWLSPVGGDETRVASTELENVLSLVGDSVWVIWKLWKRRRIYRWQTRQPESVLAHFKWRCLSILFKWHDLGMKNTTGGGLKVSQRRCFDVSCWGIIIMFILETLQAGWR